MATIGNQWPTLADWASRRDPNGGVARIVESLEKRNPILQDLPMVEGNLDTGHQITNRAALPAPTYRRINQGYASTKSTTDQVIESCSLLESRSEIDVEHPGIKAGGAGFRDSEDTAFVQGFNNEIARGIFYNSPLTAIEQFQGLTPRLDVTSGNPASGQIIKAYTATNNDQASIWLIGFGPSTVYGFFPRGSSGGFSMEDMGKMLVDSSATRLDASAAGLKFFAWVSRFVWRMGLAVADYRYVARVCNLDQSVIAGLGFAGEVGIALAMEDALAAIFDQDSVNLRFYMNRTTYSQLNKQLMGKSANLLEWINMGGKRIPAFLGVPIRVTDALLSTESPVV